MSRSDRALEFIRHFCAGSVDDLEPLLASGLCFRGPLASFDSSAAYLDSLRGHLDPTGHRIVSVTETGDDVVVLYEYSRTDGDLTIAQLFRFDNGGRIRHMQLVFDASRFR